MADGKAFDAKDLTPLEAALGSLLPRPSKIDRDRLLFLAGRASVDPPPTLFGRWVWPAATFLSSTIAAVLFALLMVRPVAGGAAVAVEGTHENADIAHADVADEPQQPNPEHQTIALEQHHASRDGWLPLFGPAPFVTPKRGELPAEPNYLQLRSYVLAYGVEALPSLSSAEPSTESHTPTTTRHIPKTQRELLQDLLKESGAMRQRAG